MPHGPGAWGAHGARGTVGTGADWATHARVTTTSLAGLRVWFWCVGVRSLLREMEAVLANVEVSTTITQVETMVMAGIAPVATCTLAANLRATTTMVLDQEWLERGLSKRVETSVSRTSELGEKAIFRTTLEFERRRCGNVSPKEDGKLTAGPVLRSEADVVAFICDPRTLANKASQDGFEARASRGEFKDVFHAQACVHMPLP